MKALSSHVLIAIGCVAMLGIPSLVNAQSDVETRIGTLGFTQDFENGYPTDETLEKLFDEIDFQRS